MEATNVDVLGPVDYLVVEFPAEKADFSGEIAAELRSLVDRELVRVLDLLLLRKDADGSVEAVELNEAQESEVGELLALEAELALLLAEEDVESIGAALEPGSYAAVVGTAAVVKYGHDRREDRRDDRGDRRDDRGLRGRR
jgi:hypothetical protein